MSPDNGKEYVASKKSQLVLLSISIGALYWIIDSLVDSFIFNNGTFTTQLFHPSLPDLCMRLFTMGILVFFGIFTNRIIIKYRQTGDSLRESEERYELTKKGSRSSVSGQEAYERIKKISPDTRVLLTSGYPSDFINKERIINEGISFVSKPVSPDKLMKKVKEVMTT